MLLRISVRKSTLNFAEKICEEEHPKMDIQLNSYVMRRCRNFPTA